MTDRLLETLERLLELPASDLETALAQASDLVAAALRADKVDAFIYDPARDSLVAVGTSRQPLSDLQRRHGLDVLPLSNGGRTVWVYRLGEPYLEGHVDQDADELRGIREALGVRSNLGVPLSIGGKRRGMIMVASQKPGHFTQDDLRFMESVAHWVGAVAHRAE
ncbi:MAG TPA: GAF domain-containing protein, partial [Myxococcales bacterium]|nr:GAF domain-containing protein [Myxococcales bacterium]